MSPSSPGIRRSTVGLITMMVLLALLNYALIEHRAELWQGFSGSGNGIPSREALYRWDVIRYAIGVVIMPVLAGLLWWFASWKAPVRTWTGWTLLAFLVGLVAMYLHLTWMYAWIRESYFAVPSGIVRAIVLVSLNAPFYLSVIGLFAIVRWLRRSDRPGVERP